MIRGKTAIVTGGSRGIGRAIVEKLASQGANVAVIYAGSQDLAQQVCTQCAQQYGSELKAYQCDVSDYEAVRQTVAQIRKEFGTVHILVNNAGITRDGLLLSMKEEDFDDVLNTNLKGAFHLTRHLYSHFMRKRRGRIINISSVVGLHGNAGQANYAAAKAGLIGLTKSIAKELAGRGVTCNAIAPGYIESDMTAAIPEKAREAILASIPAKKPGNPEDVAALAAFLAGDSASYITGEVIRVDGGMGM